MPRLKTAEQFAAVLDASKLKAAQPAGVWRSAHFALYLAPLSTITSQSSRTTIGVICPKRWAKRAVTRNTIKRQIYAVSSELESQLPFACLVLRLASGFSREQFPSATSPALKATLRAELLALFGKLSPQEKAA
ncbi:MAG: ribonuclease P protein component [Burkholderiales bacterium]|nr:MAG: ribonuclease P protein component [Burkholderiales bacterium]